MNKRRKCPWCFERLGSLGSRENVSIDIEKGVYHCWRCGAAGKLTKYKASLLKVEVSSGRFAFDPIVMDEISRQIDEKPIGLVPLYPWKDAKHSLVLRRYIKYLVRRKVTPKLMERFKLGVVFDPPKEQWYNKGNIIFPVLDGDKKGYIRHHPKKGGYFNSRGLGRQGALLNGRVLDKLPRVYVVEGPFDVTAMKGCAVGTLGTSVTDEQLSRLAKSPAEIVFALDGDSWVASRVLARRLMLRRDKVGVKWVRLPSGTDPGDLGYSDVVKLPLLTT